MRDHLQYAPARHEAAISGPLRAHAPVLMAIQVCWTATVLAAGAVDRAAADALFQADLNALAAKCDELEMAEQGGVSRNWFVPRDPRRHYLFFPPDSGPVAPAAEASTVVRQWHAKFTQLRRQQAERLFELARQSVEAGDEAAAYRLLHEVLHEDPEHAQARKVLGYARTAGSAWRRTTRRPPRRRARGPHPLFGWSPNEYWQVDSEHFELTTDLHARAGQQVVALLERVYTAWQQLFYPYWSVPGRLVARFAGEDRSLGPPPLFSVVLFRDRDEYVRQLSRAEPRIEISVGYYSQQHRKAFFYAGDDAVRDTWVHESTHQFFQETGVVAPGVGEQSNFWAVEGVALYMESLIDRQRYATTGGADAERLQFARFRGLSEGFYVPLDQLVDKGREQLQNDADLSKLYAQAAGLSHFFMHAEDGRRMRPFLEYLKSVYRGVAQRSTLQAEMGEPSAQLDETYRAYLNVTDADLAFVDPAVRSLCLGHTSVTDAGLAQLPACAALRWLDLSFTAATDRGVSRFADARLLRQLNLEKTQITDAALETVARSSGLEELDLSRTAVSDQGLERLSRLSRLKVLWLTGTQVSDAGLSALVPLSELEQLDVQDTKVTPAALESIRKRLPKLQ